MSCQEMLAVRITEITHDNTATCDAEIVLRVRMKEDRVVNFSTKPDGVVKLDKLQVL
jgi:hypothetical protein